MKVESIAECSLWSILQYFWPALIDNWSWKPIFGLFESGCFTQVIMYITYAITQESFFLIYTENEVYHNSLCTNTWFSDNDFFVWYDKDLVFGVSDQGIPKPASWATETS